MRPRSMDIDYQAAEGFTGFPDDEPKQRPHRAPVSNVRRGTVDQIREWRIAEGDCPRVCPGRLVDLCCEVCGWSLLEEQMRARLEAKETVAGLPQAELPLDEYADANLDAA